MAWLDLARDATGWALADTGRLDQLVQGMSHPDSQYPSVISFLGSSHRMLALRSLFPHNNFTRRGPAGIVRLHLSTTTAHIERPLLVAESSLRHTPVVGACSKPFCHDGSARLHIPAEESETTIGRNCRLLARLLFPWTHVACLFVHEAADWAIAKTLLRAPHPRIVASGHSGATGMRIIVVLTGTSTDDAAGGLEMIMALPGADDLGKSAISMLDLRSRHPLSGPALFAPLQRRLLDELQHSRTERIQRGLLFSAVPPSLSVAPVTFGPSQRSRAAD